MSKALIIVDVQNDFVEGGALGVEGGVLVSSKIAQFVNLGAPGFDYIVTTQDWHINPGTHFSVTPNFSTSWPVHCVAKDFGSEMVADLKKAIENSDKILSTIHKGHYDDGYSGFTGYDANTYRALTQILKENGVDEVTIVGIATDHCVKATALDAERNGFKVTVWSQYCAGVDVDETENVLKNILPEKNIKIMDW